MFILEIIYILLQALAWIALVAGLCVVGFSLWDAVAEWVAQRRRDRRAEIEAVLDRNQAELRRTVLHLADALAEERVAANETSEAMIRAAYLTRGQLP